MNELYMVYANGTSIYFETDEVYAAVAYEKFLETIKNTSDIDSETELPVKVILKDKNQNIIDSMF